MAIQDDIQWGLGQVPLADAASDIIAPATSVTLASSARTVPQIILIGVVTSVLAGFVNRLLYGRHA